MKLKLGVQNGTTVLSVTEGLEARQVAVLKAGIGKLIQTGKKDLILDLSSVDANLLKDPEIAPALTEARNWAAGLGGQVIILSPIEGIGQAKTMEEALTQAKSQLPKLLATEAALQAELETLKKKKSEAEARLSKAAPEGDFKSLLKENSDLRSLITDLERQIQNYTKKRTEPIEMAAILAKKTEVEKILAQILARESVLPVT